MIEEDRNTLPQIVVSNRNPHLLETTDGLPFLMLGDTAWELLHRITYDEAREYLEVRANQGFNMIWANVLAEFDGLHMPNRNGDLPLHNDDPSKPNEAYFAHVDRVVAAAEEFGLYVGLLPAWGDKLTAPWGEGPAIFRLNNLEVAQSYGEFLGQRYGGKTNILWVLGGDRPARLFGDEDQYPKQAAKDAGLPLDSDWTPIWAAMAYGIRKSGATHPITYHPQGGMGSTSVLLHDEPWLDMNAMQSGHGGGHDVPVWEAIARDFAMLPVKPTFDAEPNYEDHPVSPWPTWDPANGHFDDYDVRKQIYRSIFAGACGVIYGHHSVWQFSSHLYEKINYVLFDWRTAIRRPGAEQIRHLKALLMSVDMLGLAPDSGLIVDPAVVNAEHAQAIRAPDVALVYVPTDRLIAIDLSWANGRPVSVSEFDPKTGQYFLRGTVEGCQMVELSATPAVSPDRVYVIKALG